MRKITTLIFTLFIAFDSYSQNSGEYATKGLFSTSMGQYDKAMEYFNKAINMNDNPIAYVGRGELKYKLGDYRGAIQDLDKGISKFNTLTEKEFSGRSYFLYPGYEFRGLSKQKLNNYKGAIEDFSKALEYTKGYADSSISKIHFSRAEAKFSIGDKNGACLDWSKSGELGNKSAYDFIRKYCN